MRRIIIGAFGQGLIVKLSARLAVDVNGLNLFVGGVFDCQQAVIGYEYDIIAVESILLGVSFEFYLILGRSIILNDIVAVVIHKYIGTDIADKGIIAVTAVDRAALSTRADKIIIEITFNGERFVEGIGVYGLDVWIII